MIFVSLDANEEYISIVITNSRLTDVICQQFLEIKFFYILIIIIEDFEDIPGIVNVRVYQVILM